jgi:hypothetical protein
MNRSEAELCRWHAVADHSALWVMAMETILACPKAESQNKLTR